MDSNESLVGTGEPATQALLAWIVELAQVRRRFGYPRAVRTDHGPEEFTRRAFIAWTQRHGIERGLIESGRLMRNGYIESFNGKFRDEHGVTSLAQAREVIADWR